MTRFSTLTALTLTVVVVGVNAGVVAQPANRSYRVLSSKESKFQEELNREAGDGYRIVGGYASIELALLEPSVDGTTRTYVFAPNVETFLKEKKLQPGFRPYEIVVTTKTETLERELNAASARGFRLVPQSLLGIEKRVPMMGSYNYETIAILEQTADALPVTYRVLGTARLSTFEKELRTATADGFTLAAFTIGPKEVVAVLEKTTSVWN